MNTPDKLTPSDDLPSGSRMSPSIDDAHSPAAGGTTRGETHSGVDLPARPRQSSTPWRLPSRYQTRGAIARGGMGLVLRVHDVEVDRPLALKLLLDFDPAATARTHRFLEEARITGQLQHPGIPPVHEIGQLDDGRPFFSMKLIAGRTLDELLQARPTPQSELPRFLHIFEQIAQTVAYAHSQGVIHRDLKPLNVMVGAFGEVQVMDWGLAKRLRDDRTGADSTANVSTDVPALPGGTTVDYRPDTSDERTQDGQVLGTFAYMPPEQARGEIDRLDERSDVFGLGAILCQILTGEPPYRSAVNRDLWQQAREGNLSDAWARLEKCGADAELIGLARSFLAAEPVQRPRHAGMVAEQSSAYLQSVQQRLQQAEREKAIAQARTLEERKRRRWQLALAASVLFVMLGGSAAGVWYYQDRANRAAEEARQQTELANRKMRLNQDVNEALDETQRLHDALYTELADARAVSALLSDIDAWRTRVQAERSTWQRAEGLAAVEPALLDASATERLQGIGRQIDEDESDWQLAKKSDALRLGEVVVADDYFREEATGDRLAVFFREDLKLDVDGGNFEEVAGRIRRSRLRQVVIALLDYWSKIARDGGQLRRICTVARLADPDPWRDRVRDPKTWENRGKLEQLAREVDVSRQSPQILLLLAQRLKNAHGNDYALLQSALAEYPRDFWLYETLVRSTTDLTERIGYLQSALAVRPQSFVVHETLAGALDNWRHDPDGAIRHRRIALKYNPNFARAHYNLGAALLHKGDYDGAIYHCQRAMEINARFTSYAHCIIGDALLQKKDRKGAVAHYELAQASAGGDSMTFGLLGSSWYKIGRWEESAAAYRKANALEPRNADRHYNLGLALRMQNKWDEAVTAFRQAIELKPNHGNAYLGLGYALHQQDKLEEARAAYSKAIELEPSLASAYMYLGHVLRAQNKPEEAIAAYRQAIKVNPNAAAYIGLGNVLHDQRKLDDAVAAYQKAIHIEPRDATAHFNLANTLKQLRKLDAAIDSYRKAIDIEPKNASYHYNLGCALAEQNKLDAAIAAYREAIEVDPNKSEAYTNLGYALKKQRKWEEAASAFQKVIDLNPRSANAYNDLGAAWMGAGKWDKAIAAFQTAIQLDANYQKGFNNLGAALIEKGNAKEAIPYLRKAIELNPKDASAHSNLGLALRDQGQLHEAIAAFRKAIAIDPRKVKAHNELAVVLVKQKRYREASAVQGKLIELVPERVVPFGRYFAARNAVLAGCGKGVDADRLDDAERSRLRNQALAWLQDEVRLNRQLLQKGTPDERRMSLLSDWQTDEDLALVREPKELAKLPREEQQAWQRLWSDVKELTEQAKSHSKDKNPCA